MFWGLPELSRGNGDESNQQMNCGPNEQSQIPKPQEDVDFLVDDVDSQNAESILDFHGSGSSIVVESAFGHLK